MARQQAGGNAQVKPSSAVATAAAAQATQAPKTPVTIAVTPTRGVASAGKKPTTNKNYNSEHHTFAHDVAAGSEHRARHIRNTDFERLQQLFNLFVTNDDATARAINANVNAKRD
ncbi:hypothetical protein PF006_g25956 [Phytophthora fragariae]|uniref:Uncharacterized protein n=1 Tax=Phytophthora fragariae TaxID=53985 RepID=A0A6A3R0U1_9STRA|nr:hypothetical protein PF006_g25956 [Phytophthora fragariae]